MNQLTAVQQKSTFCFSMPSLNEMEQLMNFCKVMATAKFYSNLGPSGIMAIYLTAKENNLPFMACLNGGVYTFDGKVTFSAQLINAMIISAGHRVDIIELNEQVCRLRFIRCDRHENGYKGFDYEYNIRQAEKAGYLKKTNWQTSPKDMLFSRCLTGGGRKYIPEVFVGVFVAGELIGDQSDSEIIPQVPIEVTQFETSIDTPKLSEVTPAVGYGDFIAKHHLLANSDGTISRQLEFVRYSAVKTKISVMKVIDFAIKNEQEFEKRFKKWEEENYPIADLSPKSMDELVETV